MEFNIALVIQGFVFNFSFALDNFVFGTFLYVISLTFLIKLFNFVLIELSD